MANECRSINVLLIAGVLFLTVQVKIAAAPMGTAFTYQGRFNAGGNPANGAYDFEFRLFDAATAGTQVGSTVTKEDISVSDGYFTTTLDFTASPFGGNARWLQIAVRPGAETGAYTTLTPRHELTPTPYALYSDNACSTNYIPRITSNGMANSVMYQTSSNIGIGTTTPGQRLAVAGVYSAGSSVNAAKFGTPGFGGTAGDKVNILFGHSAGTDYGRIGIHAPGSDDMAMNLGVWNGTSIADILTLKKNGNVGIGTTTPSHLLTTQDTGTVTAVNLSNVLYVDAANDRVGIGTDNPICALDIRSSSPQVNVQGPWPALELRSTTGGYPLIDFSNDASIDYDMRLVTMGDDTLEVDGGNLGIGTAAPTQKLDVSGNVRCVDVIETSDERLKVDIQPLDRVLDKLDRVRAVSFRWNEKGQSLGATANTRRIGVLAQELEQVFPEIVTTPKPTMADELLRNYPKEALTPEIQQQLQRDAEGTQYKGVSYSQLTAVLLEAIKELKRENDSLKSQLERIDALEARLRQLDGK